MKIKALSLWQPHATLFVLNLRRIEKRTRPLSYRGPLLICASKETREAKRLLGFDYFSGSAFIKSLLKPHGYQSWRDLPYGMAVAIADMTDCRETKELTAKDYTDDFWFHYPGGRYGLIWENIRPITPFPVIGRQGLFEVEAEHLAKQLAVPASTVYA